MEKGKEPRKTVCPVKSSLYLSHRGCASEHKFHDRQRRGHLFIFPRVTAWPLGPNFPSRLLQAAEHSSLAVLSCYSSNWEMGSLLSKGNLSCVSYSGLNEVHILTIFHVLTTLLSTVGNLMMHSLFSRSLHLKRNKTEA